MESEKVIKFLRRVCKAEKIEVPDSVLELIANKCGGHVRDCLKMLELVANAIESGAIKDIEVTHVEEHVSRMLGVPNYELVQSYLSNIYAGKPSEAVRYAASCSMPKPLFLKAVVEVHGNVMLALMSKNVRDVITDGYVLRYTGSVISASGLERNEETVTKMRTMSLDMAEWFGRAGNFQFNDNVVALASIAAHNAPLFKRQKSKGGK
jgi:DNA polymerase III gamma/tau subunit